MNKQVKLAVGFVLVLLNVIRVGVSTEIAAQTPQLFKCQIVSAARADKLEDGFFSWTAKDPSTASGVILVAKLTYPPDTKELLSGDLALEYKVGGQLQSSSALGFNPRGPDRIAVPPPISCFWILHAEATYKYPVEGEGFDGVKGQETMQFLFQVPNDVITASLLYQGKSRGDAAKIPKR